MLLKFDEYNKFIQLNRTDDNFLNERLSISEDVISETMRVIKYIESEISNGNFKIVSDKEINNGMDYDVIRLSNYEIKLFDKKCMIYLAIHRFIGDDPSGELNTLGTEATIGVNIRHLLKTHVNFELSGDIILNNDKITEASYAILAHEIRHAYEQVKIYDDKPYFTVRQITEAGKKWTNIYREVNRYLNNSKSAQDLINNNEVEFYKIMYSVYMSDVSEISAFTQQAYEQCKKCKTLEDLKNSMKKSKLQTMLDVYTLALDFLKNPEIQANFNEKISKYGLTEIPSFKKLEMLFQKRHKKAKANYGKVFTFIKEEIDSDENGEVIFTDVKY